MKTEMSDLRMPADKFDRMMKRALQTPPPKKEKHEGEPKEPKAKPNK